MAYDGLAYCVWQGEMGMDAGSPKMVWNQRDGGV